MRSHGDPNQSDPTIDAHGVIYITMRNVSEALSSEVHGNSGPCSQYEQQAENALRAANPVPAPPDEAQQLKYAECMRANGVPNYPDPKPTEQEQSLNGVDPNSPFVQSANKICAKQTGAPSWWASGTGPPGDVVVTSCNGPICPNGPPPSGGRPTRSPGSSGGSGANSGAGANSPPTSIG
jgi:hypothetical protein